MAAAPAPKHFDIRQAHTRDFNRLLRFYRQHASAALPAPTAKTVGDTIAQGRILLVESAESPEIVASGAVFEVSPAGALTYVGELAGMRATSAVGGLAPVSMQVVLLGLRLLGHVATEPRVVRKGATNSLITIVKEGNGASIRNIEAVGMKPLSKRPEWFRYDEFVWHGMEVDAGWKYYYADTDTIVEVLRLLSPVGLFDNEIRLTRTERATDSVESFEFHLELADIGRAQADLKDVLEKGTGVDLVAPPEEFGF